MMKNWAIEVGLFNLEQTLLLSQPENRIQIDNSNFLVALYRDRA